MFVKFKFIFGFVILIYLCLSIQFVNCGRDDDEEAEEETLNEITADARKILDDILTKLGEASVKIFNRNTKNYRDYFDYAMQLNELHSDIVEMVRALSNNGKIECQKQISTFYDRIEKASEGTNEYTTIQATFEKAKVDQKTIEELEELQNQLAVATKRVLDDAITGLKSTVEDLSSVKRLYDSSVDLNAEEAERFLDLLDKRLDTLRRKSQSRINYDYISQQQETINRYKTKIAAIKEKLNYRADFRCSKIETSKLVNQTTAIYSPAFVRSKDELLIWIEDYLKKELDGFNDKATSLDLFANEHLKNKFDTLLQKVQQSIENIKMDINQETEEVNKRLERVRKALDDKNVDGVSEEEWNQLTSQNDVKRYVELLSSTFDFDKTLTRVKEIDVFKMAIYGIQIAVTENGKKEQKTGEELQLYVEEQTPSHIIDLMKKKYRAAFVVEEMVYSYNVYDFWPSIHELNTQFGYKIVNQTFQEITHRQFIHDRFDYWSADLRLYLNNFFFLFTTFPYDSLKTGWSPNFNTVFTQQIYPKLKAYLPIGRFESEGQDMSYLDKANVINFNMNNLKKDLLEITS